MMLRVPRLRLGKMMKKRNQSSKSTSPKAYKAQMIRKPHQPSKFQKSQGQMTVLKRKRKIKRSQTVPQPVRKLHLEHRKREVIAKTVTI